MSYCDRSKSTGQGYLAAGFVLESTTGPGYFWTNGTDQLSRYQAQKKILQNFYQTIVQITAKVKTCLLTSGVGIGIAGIGFLCTNEKAGHC